MSMNSHTDNVACPVGASGTKANIDSSDVPSQSPGEAAGDQKLKPESDQKSSLTTPIPPPSSSLSTNGLTKSHKVEGKNKKSLYHKQQQQNLTQSQQRANQHNQQQTALTLQQQQAVSSNRRSAQKSPSGSNNKSANQAASKPELGTNCSTLEEFSSRAQDLKSDINKALEKQAHHHQTTEQPYEVVKLKEDILKLSGLKASKKNAADSSVSKSNDKSQEKKTSSDDKLPDDKSSLSDHDTQLVGSESSTASCQNVKESSPIEVNQSKDILQLSQNEPNNKTTSDIEESNAGPEGYKSDLSLFRALDKLKLEEEVPNKDDNSKTHDKSMSKKQRNLIQTETMGNAASIISKEFEPLNAKLDASSKFVALKSSLQKHFSETPNLLEPICLKMVDLSEQNNQLKSNCEQYQSENLKLNLVKQKLENLCRELQKSNNAIRIESLDLIKVEQSKAKEQTTKIQSTLSGVIKLFDENQQRNMTLRQENQELQTKLKSLLDHCDNWEKSVEAALRQRDIENRLLKTELAKANLVKNEEKEKFLGEKQELLQILSMMQEQQHRIEGQEAKLRSDLSSYASKYDECQQVISKGMNRFQTESKKMLKQIERSKQDYKVLLSKYESSNKRMAQLLEEKQYWDRAMNIANKKIETLERLCRALKDRKQEGKSDTSNNQKSNKAGKMSNVSKLSNKKNLGTKDPATSEPDNECCKSPVDNEELQPETKQVDFEHCKDLHDESDKSEQTSKTSEESKNEIVEAIDVKTS